MSRFVFVDTSAFVAAWADNERDHADARDSIERALRGGRQLLTTNFVIAEAYTVFVNRFADGRRLGLAFVTAARDGLCEIERATLIDELKAEGILLRHADKRYSYFDALSFAVMERLGIEDYIAYDRHFREYGRFQPL